MTLVANNVTRLLVSKKVAFQAFELPPEKVGALETARLLGVPAGQVFKTIVVVREKGKPLLAVIPGPCQVDLKAVAKSIGARKVFLPTEREAEGLTGLQACGISPLALTHKGFQALVDENARLFEQVYISGGRRGLNIRLPLTALVELTGAHFAAISLPNPAIG
ncbi:MAG: hypothetical protein FJZ96_03940 [Chloroflexi bacterium]|nr:hypothetical protein [Chloroflexota bacterium]